MRPATRPSIRADTASGTLPPAVTTPLPELVSPLEEPELPDDAEAEAVAAPVDVPVAVDVSSVLDGRGCPVATGAVGTTGTCER